jgi:hypothetical protein
MSMKNDVNELELNGLELIEFGDRDAIIESVETITAFDTSVLNSDDKYTINFTNGDRLSNLHFLGGDDEEARFENESMNLEITVFSQDVESITDNYDNSYYLVNKNKYYLTNKFLDNLDGIFLVEKTLETSIRNVKVKELVYLTKDKWDNYLTEQNLSSSAFQRHEIYLESIYNETYKIIGRLRIGNSMEIKK